MTPAYPQTLSMAECEAVTGGIAPLLAAAYALVTSKTFLAFTATLAVMSVVSETGTELLE